MPPGWYDDPDGSPNAERRWDGLKWTPERRRKPTHNPASSYPPPVAPPSYPPPLQGPPPYQSAPPPPYFPAGPVQASPYPQSIPPHYPQPPSPSPEPSQPDQTAASNVFSIIAFVCAGLAVLGGLTLIALPTIFGIASIICAIVALSKKERLAPYAIGSALGGLIVGWMLQAAVFNSVFG